MSRPGAVFLLVSFALVGISRETHPQEAASSDRKGAAPLTIVDYLSDRESLLIGSIQSSAGQARLRLKVDDPESASFAVFGPALKVDASAAIAVVRDDLGGFGSDDVFVTGRGAGEIIRVSGDGRTIAAPWTVITADSSPLTALHVDRTGAFDGALLAASRAGNIWQVSADGRATLLASTGVSIVALLTLPTIPERYGPWAGGILAASAAPGCRVVAIDRDGAVRFSDIGVCVTDLEVVAPNAAAYGIRDGYDSANTASVPVQIAAEDLASHSCAVAYAASNATAGTVSWSGNAPVALALRPGLRLRALTFPVAENLCQPELCGDGIDNNNDGDIDEGCPDCDDGEDKDQHAVVDDNCMEICGDKVDNDDDGLVDAPCPEACGDGLDNDMDGVVDNGCPLATADRACEPSVWAARRTWPAGFTPKTTLEVLFPGIAGLADLATTTIADTLRSTSTAPVRVLAREAAAALLSASDARVGYPVRADRLGVQVRDVMLSGSEARVSALADVLHRLNGQSCPLTRR